MPCCEEDDWEQARENGKDSSKPQQCESQRLYQNPNSGSITPRPLCQLPDPMICGVAWLMPQARNIANSFNFPPSGFGALLTSSPGFSKCLIPLDGAQCRRLLLLPLPVLPQILAIRVIRREITPLMSPAPVLRAITQLIMMLPLL